MTMTNHQSSSGHQRLNRLASRHHRIFMMILCSFHCGTSSSY